MIEPLFILAPPRSFTSVACAMIGNNPDMIGLAETNLFAADTYGDLETMYRTRPRFQHGLLRSIAEIGLGAQNETNIDAARDWLAQNRSLTTAEIFLDLMEWAAPRGLVDKSPIYVFSVDALDRITTAFPEARFLHLTRHPRATCESIYKTRQQAAAIGQGGREKEATPENMWLRPHLRIIDALSDVPPEQHMRLRGELLLADPPLYLRQIAEWLGIRSDDEAVEAMLHPERSPFARPGPSNAPMGNDPSFMQAPALRPFQPGESDLESPLSWDANLRFDEVLVHYATMFGY